MYLTVQLGDRLPTVALAQARLIENGAPDLRVDGIFGPRTHAAVRKFQRDAGEQETGKVDQQTWRALTRKLPINVVDVIDASDLRVLFEDHPFLRDGDSEVVLSFGMSRGTQELIEQLVRKYGQGTVGLLRFHGHGGPGEMRVAGGGAVTTSSIAALHFRFTQAWDYYRLLGSVLKPYGSIEMHGCRVAAGAQGQRLMTAFADACGHPVSAGLRYQMGGKRANRFEGPTATSCPRRVPLSMWAATAFARCQW